MIRKPAAYIVKAALDTEKLVAGSSVWCFSDILREFSEIQKEFHGGFGLLTHSGDTETCLLCYENAGRIV